MNIQFAFALGDEVQCRVTGYKGIVVGLTTWLYGCKRITVQSQKKKDFKPVDAMVFDEGALRLLKENAIAVDKVQVATNPGGPREDSGRTTHSAERSPR